jgi:hypothetical protein
MNEHCGITHTVPLTGGRFMTRFPGTSCQATFIKSLGDEADYERKPLNRQPTVRIKQQLGGGESNH